MRLGQRHNRGRDTEADAGRQTKAEGERGSDREAEGVAEAEWERHRQKSRETEGATEAGRVQANAQSLRQ